MMISTFILTTALATIPKVPVLEFSMLPVTKGPSYTFEIQLELQNRQKINCGAIRIARSGDFENKDFGDREIAMLLANTTLENEECNKYNDGLRLVILNCGGKKIIGVKVLGNGPKPIVRWMYRPLPRKKK